MRNAVNILKILSYIKYFLQTFINIDTFIKQQSKGIKSSHE